MQVGQSSVLKVVLPIHKSGVGEGTRRTANAMANGGACPMNKRAEVAEENDRREVVLDVSQEQAHDTVVSSSETCLIRRVLKGCERSVLNGCDALVQALPEDLLLESVKGLSVLTMPLLFALVGSLFVKEGACLLDVSSCSKSALVGAPVFLAGGLGLYVASGCRSRSEISILYLLAVAYAPAAMAIGNGLVGGSKQFMVDSLGGAGIAAVVLCIIGNGGDN